MHRVSCLMRLNQKRRTKRRLPNRIRQPLVATPWVNFTWALDFMHDALYGGRAIRALNVIDEADRSCLGIHIATSIPALRVTRFLDQLVEIHGKPQAIRCDNGPELTSYEFTHWCVTRNIEVRFIQPGKPDQNAFIERFNRTYREEVLDAYLFASLDEVRGITDEWIVRYNQQRPHDTLGSLPPARYREQLLAMANSTSEVYLTGKHTGQLTKEFVEFSKSIMFSVLLLVSFFVAFQNVIAHEFGFAATPRLLANLERSAHD